MAHQDVIPVEEVTRSLWRADPFGGEIEDGGGRGCGVIDDKGSLIALMEAAKTLAERGLQPKRTIYIVSGHDEEARGSSARSAVSA